MNLTEFLSRATQCSGLPGNEQEVAAFMREAFAPILAIEGAIKPMMISGTQKLISWPITYLTVTTTFITETPAICPKRMPSTTPSSSRNGRMPHSFFIRLFPPWMISIYTD